MVRLVHCSDVLLGKPFPHALPRAEELRREVLLGGLRAAVDLAGREADALLLAGNTLAHTRVGEAEVRELSRILSGSRVPVFLLPGLTDPCTADSPYRLPELFSPPVHVLTAEAPVEGPGFRLYPFPVEPPPEDAGLVRVAIACLPPPGPAGGRSGFDYAALGGSAAPAECAWGRWSGSPEATEYGQPRGQVLHVTLPGPGRPEVVEPRLTGRMTWLDWKRPAADLEGIAAEVEDLPDPSRTLLRLVLEGPLDYEAALGLEERLEGLRSRLWHLEAEDCTELRVPLDGVFTAPLLARMVRELREQARPDSPEGVLAASALVELGRLVRGSGLEDLV